MKILTCNIRYSGADDGQNGWTYRREICVDVIKAQNPDIICFQEMWRDQFQDLRAAFPDFHHYGLVARVEETHPLNSIFYRPDRFDLIAAGGYWLSETPHLTGSKSWQSNGVRFANWVRLIDRSSGGEFRVVNTHLDHISAQARVNQARVIVDETGGYPQNYPQILSGDMNCDPNSVPIATFKAGGWRDTYEAIYGPTDTGFTYHEFLGPAYDSDIGQIDWIFVKGQVQVKEAAIIKDSTEGRYPSDHYFISTTLEV